jgi:hypothetical protein
VDAVALCPGGDCIQNLTVPAIERVDTCIPQTTGGYGGSRPVEVTWDEKLLVCYGSAPDHPSTCNDSSLTCAPQQNPGDNRFRTCVYPTQDFGKDIACPPEYPDRLDYFYGVDDQRQCTPCTCEALQGSKCTASLSVYRDPACTKPLLDFDIDDEQGQCKPLPTSTEPPVLRSKKVSHWEYTPGTCTARGGKASGEAKEAFPVTVCCAAKPPSHLAEPPKMPPPSP